MSDGSIVRAIRVWIRNNGTGTWHGISCTIVMKKRDIMKFLIQANSPECTMNFDKEDYNLATAIETIFPLMTENAILMWHHLCIPLSYKYDISRKQL